MPDLPSNVNQTKRVVCFTLLIVCLFGALLSLFLPCATIRGEPLYFFSFLFEPPLIWKPAMSCF